MVLQTSVDPNFNFKVILLLLFLMLTAIVSAAILGYLLYNSAENFGLL